MFKPILTAEDLPKVGEPLPSNVICRTLRHPSDDDHFDTKKTTMDTKHIDDWVAELVKLHGALPDQPLVDDMKAAMVALAAGRPLPALAKAAPVTPNPKGRPRQ